MNLEICFNQSKDLSASTFFKIKKDKKVTKKFNTVNNRATKTRDKHYSILYKAVLVHL